MTPNPTSESTNTAYVPEGRAYSQRDIGGGSEGQSNTPSLTSSPNTDELTQDVLAKLQQWFSLFSDVENFVAPMASVRNAKDQETLEKLKNVSGALDKKLLLLRLKLEMCHAEKLEKLD